MFMSLEVEKSTNLLNFDFAFPRASLSSMPEDSRSAPDSHRNVQRHVTIHYSGTNASSARPILNLVVGKIDRRRRKAFRS